MEDEHEIRYIKCPNCGKRFSKEQDQGGWEKSGKVAQTLKYGVVYGAHLLGEGVGNLVNPQLGRYLGHGLSHGIGDFLNIDNKPHFEHKCPYCGAKWKVE